MSDRFYRYDHMKEDYKPDNLPKPFHPRKISIMPGETTIHSFEVPFIT